jgi:SAM-dependent methyltransferase
MKKTKEIRLDLGCGPNKKEGFIGVDRKPFKGVDCVLDLTAQWTWRDATVDEIHSSHFVEHLDADERVDFVNECWRVLKPGGFATIIAPYAFSERAYGDLTHKWPPVVGFWGQYLNKAWREANAPHSNYADAVDFEVVGWYSVRGDVALKSQDAQAFATQNYVGAVEDIHFRWTKKK